MAHNQIAFVDDLDYLSEYDVLETYDLAEEGYAAVIECDDTSDVEAVNYDTFENYDEYLTIELAFEDADVSANAGDWASLSDVRTLHDAPATNGDGAGVTVVVMDSGIDPSHKTFRDGQIVERHNPSGGGSNDSVGHGTACAGQIARLAPACDLIDLRIFGNNGSTSLRTVVEAYSWLLNNTKKYDVVNMSWGTSKKVRKLEKLQNRLVKKGVRDVTAAGNSGGKGGSPATADKAFSTGACNKDGRMAKFSSYNPDSGNPEVAALGVDCRLARAQGTSMGRPINEDWVVASGTSFSAPHVSGMVAKYLSVNSGATPADIKDAFVSTADDIENVPKDGSGLVKYMAALGKKPDREEPSEQAQATVWEFSGRDSIWISEDWLKDGQYTVTRDKLLEAFGQK